MRMYFLLLNFRSFQKSEKKLLIRKKLSFFAKKRFHFSERFLRQTYWAEKEPMVAGRLVNNIDLTIKQILKLACFSSGMKEFGVQY